jgi:flagellar biosynthesis/type III secretory pathway protein FliH
MMAEYDDIDAAMQLEHDNGYNEGYHEGYHDGYGDGQDGCPPRMKRSEIMTESNIYEYLNNNKDFRDLYKHNIIVHTCIDAAIDNDHSVDEMLARTVILLARYNKDVTSDLIRLQLHADIDL